MGTTYGNGPRRQKAPTTPTVSDSQRSGVGTGALVARRAAEPISADSFSLFCQLAIDGTVLSVNEDAVLTLGAVPEDVIGAPVWTGPWWSGDDEAINGVRTACTSAAQGKIARCNVAARTEVDRIEEMAIQVAPWRSDDDGAISHLVFSALCATPGPSDRVGLAPSHGRLQALPAVMTNMWFADADGLVTWARSGWHTFFGTGDSQQPRHWYDGVHPDDRDVCMKDWQTARATRRECCIEARHLRHDKTYRWMESRLTPVGEDHGEPAGWIGTLVDIHERKQSEEARATLRAIVKSTDDALLGLTFDGRITSWNSGAERHFEYKPSEVIGQSIDILIPEELRGEEREFRNRIRDGQSVVQHETVRLSKSGRRLDISLTITPITDRHGRVIGVSKVGRNITESKRNLEALRENERRFRELIDALPTAIYTTDEQGRITHFNPAAVEFSGRTPQLHTDKWCVTWKLYHPDGTPMPHDQTPMAMALREGRSVSGATVIAERPDGSRRWFQPYPTPLKDKSGKLIGAVNMLVDITDRKRAEEAMQQSEQRYRDVVEGQAELLCRFHPDGTIHFCNGAYARSRDTTPEALMGTNLWEFVSAQDREHVRELLDQITPDNPEITIENRVETAQGTRWTLWRNRGLQFDEHGRPTELQSSGIDITDRKTVEETLRRSEEELSDFFEHAPVGLHQVGPDGRVQRVNRAELEMLGYTRDEYVGHEIAEFYVDKALIADILDRLSRGEVLREQPVELRCKDGSTRHTLVSSTPRMESGQFVHSRCFTLDVTQRNRAQRALKASEARYRAAIETALDCVITMDAHGKVLGFNPAAEQTFGYTPQEAIGQDLADLIIPPELHDAHRAGLKRCVETGKSKVLNKRFEMPALKRDGRRITVELSISRTPGDPLTFTGFLRDITEQKQAEESLKRSHDQLEQRVAERTAELQHRAQQLARLTSELTLAEQRERKRLARLLHDHLQQLLASGRLGLDFITDNGDERQTEWIEHIRSCLDESIEASRSLSVELCPPILHEGGLAAGCEWLARWVDENYEFQLELDVDANANPDREDVRTLVFESIRELVFNSVKHGGVGKAKLELACNDEANLRVVVSDEGTGFDPAQTLGASQDRGFGLFSISERLAHLGGSFEIDSKPGKGSRFTLIAPRLTQCVLDVEEDESSLDSEMTVAGMVVVPESNNGDRIRVMVVDDHAVMRQGLCTLLAQQPTIEVVGEASDGARAVRRAQVLRPDVIVMDYSMPRMNGAEATRRILRDLPETKIIGLSMYKDTELAAPLKEAGAVEYLTKSAGTEALIAAIMKHAAQSA